MKLSKKQAFEFLKTLLADVEDAGEDNAEFNQEEANEALAGKILSERRAAIEQEAAGKTRTAVHGEIASMQLKQVAKAFGITDKKELEGLEFSAMLEKGKGLYANSLKLNAEDWNEKNKELAEMLEAERAAHTDALNKANAEWEGKFNLRDVNSRWLEVMSKIKTVGGELGEQASMLHHSAAAKGYDIKYNPEKKINEFYKDNQLVIDNGKVIDDATFASEWAKKAGILATDNRHDPPGRGGNNGNPDPGNGQAKPGDPYAAIKSYANA